jgi:hypothetical protein
MRQGNSKQRVMKNSYNRLPLLVKLYALLLLFPIPFFSTAQNTGVWEKVEVKEKMTDVAVHKKRNATFSFSAKSDDKGMNFEMSSVWANDKKTHTYRGHVAWEWTCQKGPGTLVPGEQVTIKGIISNLSTEPSSSICAYAVFGNWGFMKPQSGKSGDECAKPNGTATMIGSFPVPKQPGLNRDGTPNLFLYLKLSLHGGNESRFIDRTITYKWKPVTGQTEPTPPPVVIPPPATNAPQAWAEKTEYKVGEPIVVKFKNLPGFAKDWIGIYGAKAYHANEYIEWKYTNGLKEGSMQFNSPRYGAGDYIFRIYENNGYKLLVQTVAFKVVP